MNARMKTNCMMSVVVALFCISVLLAPLHAGQPVGGRSKSVSPPSPARVRVALAIKNASGEWGDDCRVSYSLDHGREWHALPNNVRPGTVSRLGDGYPRELHGRVVNFLCYSYIDTMEGAMVLYRVFKKGYRPEVIRDRVPDRPGSYPSFIFCRTITLTRGR